MHGVRPKLHLPVLGQALRAPGDMACSSFFFWKAVSLITLSREGPCWPRGRHKARENGMFVIWKATL
jgi:hypothetical protein